MELSHLYILRHGIAEAEHPEHPGVDFERRLTDKGVERTRLAAQGLERLGIAPQVIWTSPYVRTRQTAQIVAEALSPPAGVEVVPSLACEGEQPELLEALRGAKVRSLLLIGHEPNLSELVSELISPRALVRLRFKKAGFAHLELHPVHRRIVGRLQAWLPPRTLRMLASAEPDETDQDP